MTCSDIQRFFRIDDMQRFEGVVVIEERFPLAHCNQAAGAQLHIGLGDDYLVDDFADCEVAGEPPFPCRAERALHRASRLRGKANRKFRVAVG